MSVSTEKQSATVALLGNPNTGKSTLFTALAGVRQRTGNYPGVTVEKKVGRTSIEGRSVTLVDLPGTYSLAPRSPDEMVAVDVLLGRQKDVAPPDAILCIVDAGNLQRNLYLVSQALELGRPVVVAVNMVDLAEKRGKTIDAARLEKQIGAPVVLIQANRRVGLDELRRRLIEAIDAPAAEREGPLPAAFRKEVESLRSTIGQNGAAPERYLVERLLLDTSGYIEDHMLGDRPAARETLKAARTRLAEAGCAIPAVEATSRYAWAAKMLEGVVRRGDDVGVSMSDRVDRILTHRWIGTFLFGAMMLFVFQAVFVGAEWPMDQIEGLKNFAAEAVESRMSDGALRSLVTSGVIEGVGGVLVFLPQILLLFLFIGILEDCGYMARAAYLMDKLMTRVGLSGKSFIPLLTSFGCAIPGVMAARVIENRRDRLLTILVAPLMSCAARWPVYVLLTEAFIPARPVIGSFVDLRGVTIFCMYLLGIFTAVCVALLLRRTILKGETPPFVMELPSYKLPSLGVVLYRVFDRGRAFVVRAGTLIFAVTVLVWASAYFPRSGESLDPSFAARQSAIELETKAAASDEELLAALDERQSALDDEIEGAYLRHSYLGRAGQWVEPVVAPIGWDWRIGCAVIASFPAREVVVGTLGVIYDLGKDEDEDSLSLREKLQTARRDDGTKAYNIPVALSILVFFALCAQCAATIAVIKRETNSWRWPAFTFAYMTTLAYFGALATYRIGMYFS